MPSGVWRFSSIGNLPILSLSVVGYPLKMEQNIIPFHHAVPAVLRTQVARICVLGRYLTEALDLQHVEPSLHEDAAADRIVVHILEILREQRRKLEELAKAIPGIQEDFLAPSVSMAGLFMKFISKRRPRQVTAMLRNDRMMLRLATMNYRALHAIGGKVGDDRVVALAQAHLEQLAELGQELRGLAPGSPDEAEELILADFAVHEDTGFEPIPC